MLHSRQEEMNRQILPHLAAAGAINRADIEVVLVDRNSMTLISIAIIRLESGENYFGCLSCHFLTRIELI